MPHSIRRTTTRALLLVKAGALATIAALTLGLGATAGPPVAGSAALSTWLPGPAQRLLDEHDCSAYGFGGAAQPRSAVIRSGSGKLRFVDFETGWDVYTRRGRARLVAVCLDAPPA